MEMSVIISKLKYKAPPPPPKKKKKKKKKSSKMIKEMLLHTPVVAVEVCLLVSLLLINTF